MVFPNMQAIFGFHTFVGDAGAEHFGKSVNIDGMHVKCLFNFLPHGICPRFCPKNCHIKRGVARINSHFMELFQDVEHIGRRHHDGRGFEILNKRHLTFSHPAGDWHHRATKPLCPVMGSKPSGKQPVSINDIHNIARFRTTCAHGAGNHIRPHAHIVFGISHHRRLSRRTRGRMDARNLITRYGEKPERIMIT